MPADLERPSRIYLQSLGDVGDQTLGFLADRRLIEIEMNAIKIELADGLERLLHSSLL